jgi:hypothetical protein
MLEYSGVSLQRFTGRHQGRQRSGSVARRQAYAQACRDEVSHLAVVDAPLPGTSRIGSPLRGAWGSTTTSTTVPPSHAIAAAMYASKSQGSPCISLSWVTQDLVGVRLDGTCHLFGVPHVARMCLPAERLVLGRGHGLQERSDHLPD